MGKMSIEERKNKIIELAGDDISVAINLTVSGAKIEAFKPHVIVSGNVMYQGQNDQPSE